MAIIAPLLRWKARGGMNLCLISNVLIDYLGPKEPFFLLSSESSHRRILW